MIWTLSGFAIVGLTLLILFRRILSLTIRLEKVEQCGGPGIDQSDPWGSPRRAVRSWGT
jgi:hypothetical protein